MVLQLIATGGVFVTPLFYLGCGMTKISRFKILNQTDKAYLLELETLVDTVQLWVPKSVASFETVDFHGVEDPDESVLYVEDWFVDKMHEAAGEYLVLN